MTDNEIIKALEKFKCVNCNGDCAKESYDDLDCPLNLAKFSLDLINRQKAEIERLEDMLDGSVSSERNTVDNIQYEKAEAIKEFAERLKKKKDVEFVTVNGLTYQYETVDVDEIDNLVKEMRTNK